jgi:hypothetical protein
VDDVVGLLRSFQRIFEALMNRLDKDEARTPAPLEGPPHVPVHTGIIHHELQKLNFLEFFGSPDGVAIEEWLENMAM